MSRGDALDVLEGLADWAVEQADCLELLALLPDNCVDAIVTDPPAGIEFMGKGWDRFTGRLPTPNGQQTDVWDTNAGTPFARRPTPRPRGKTNLSLQPFQDFIAEVFAEVLRVLKPGGHALVWALPRTSHHTMMGLERAGFDIRDVIVHLQSQGFPKGLDVAKAISKMEAGFPQGGAYPESPNHGKYKGGTIKAGHATGRGFGAGPGQFLTGEEVPFDVDLSETGKQWDGWNVALKPAAEYWVLARKPPSEPNVAQNVLKWGTGAINVGATRVGAEPVLINTWDDGSKPFGGGAGHPYTGRTQAGRWPANLTLQHDDRCVETGDEDGKEITPVWACPPFCPVRMLDESVPGQKSGGTPKTRRADKFRAVYSGFKGAESESGIRSSAGAVSRFFYTAKASRSERETGLAEAGIEPARSLYRPNDPDEASDLVDRLHGSVPRRNDHPCLKPIALMKWLTRLVTPPNGLILDPFAGSGTTGIAAVTQDFRCLMIEQDERYCQIAAARVAYWEQQREVEAKEGKP